MTNKTRSIETLLMEIRATVTVRRQFEFHDESESHARFGLFGLSQFRTKNQ